MITNLEKFVLCSILIAKYIQKFICYNLFLCETIKGVEKIIFDLVSAQSLLAEISSERI